MTMNRIGRLLWLGAGVLFALSRSTMRQRAPKELTDTQSNQVSNSAPVSDKTTTLYQVASSQWIHGEQMRWTILYNFLVGNTILLVAWVSVLKT